MTSLIHGNTITNGGSIPAVVATAASAKNASTSSCTIAPSEPEQPQNPLLAGTVNIADCGGCSVLSVIVWGLSRTSTVVFGSAELMRTMKSTSNRCCNALLSSGFAIEK